ncbi:hypothetical protein BDK51DRAFT_33957 [Blyttiomyces helicus]|uniref:Uncharacterized protein n=1 Tax=Blyttiomyces helicus TaxID=388810 RepID=A0A4P9WL18_9FUNG|nr:hypothetical protein BDK51DRAFT_33957 [Blyttiomyces helicus]|eukprot:RKO93534.1 hypothetical protein BDK51DRAFT_33957 [Blyttiomyces helicus]
MSSNNFGDITSVDLTKVTYNANGAILLVSNSTLPTLAISHAADAGDEPFSFGKLTPLTASGDTTVPNSNTNDVFQPLPADFRLPQNDPPDSSDFPQHSENFSVSSES